MTYHPEISIMSCKIYLNLGTILQLLYALCNVLKLFTNICKQVKSNSQEPEIITNTCSAIFTNFVRLAIYEGRSKSSRKSAIIFLFCKSAELNYNSYIDKHYLYLYSKFCCSGMNTMLTVVAMETVHHDYRPTFVHFCKMSMFNDGVAFDSLPCFFHQFNMLAVSS